MEFAVPPGRYGRTVKVTIGFSDTLEDGQTIVVVPVIEGWGVEFLSSALLLHMVGDDG